jgi:Raf kinase inhibitor-like YbhB/YbcL family protein
MMFQQALGAASIQINSGAFAANASIPAKYTQDGENISPPLCWVGVPSDAKELLLICEDPDAPREPAVHWIMYHIAPWMAGIPENIPQGGVPGIPPGVFQGANYSGQPGYIGPKPPIGHGIHHYHFQLFALAEPLRLTEPATKDTLLNAMQGIILAQGQLVGTYERIEKHA